MKRRKKTSFTVKRLILLTSLFIGIGICTWYFFIRPQAESSIQLQPLPEGFLSHGIDVSHHQGEIDWDEFIRNNYRTSQTEEASISEDEKIISFVYCKVTEGTNFIDSQWKRNHKMLSEGKMKHGGYHFFTPDISGELQALHFLAYYSHAQIQLPPVLDAEVPASTNERLIAGMKDWLELVESETGVRPIIYTSYSIYRDIMKGKFSGYQFWIASYNPNENRVQDSEIIHWQYSDRGNVPGITGLVDLNFSKLEYKPRIERAD